MNRQINAEELDFQIDAMFAGQDSTHTLDSNSLVAIAASLRTLPSPDFKARVKRDLMEEVEVTEPAITTFEQVTGAAAFAQILAPFGSDQTRIFPADHRSFIVSFVSHAAVIMLIASGIWVGQTTVQKRNLANSELTYLPAGQGGGGSGDRNPIPATKGTPPNMSARQLAPPMIVTRDTNPILPVPPTVVGPPDVKLPQSNRIGEVLSQNIAVPSNGSGTGGGPGSGDGTGLGGGAGVGVGPGFDRGLGGGLLSRRSGVVAPRAIYDPEPEYSEEARKVKQQGTVILSLVVDQQGRARDIRLVRSLGMGLDEKAVEAVKKWKFSPGMKDGIPVAMQVNVEVNFRLY